MNCIFITVHVHTCRDRGHHRRAQHHPVRAPRAAHGDQEAAVCAQKGVLRPSVEPDSVCCTMKRRGGRRAEGVTHTFLLHFAIQELCKCATAAKKDRMCDKCFSLGQRYCTRTRFHLLTALCEKKPTKPRLIHASHEKGCRSYVGWF